MCRWRRSRHTCATSTPTGCADPWQGRRTGAHPGPHRDRRCRGVGRVGLPLAGLLRSVPRRRCSCRRRDGTADCHGVGNETGCVRARCAAAPACTSSAPAPCNRRGPATRSRRSRRDAWRTRTGGGYRSPKATRGRATLGEVIDTVNQVPAARLRDVLAAPASPTAHGCTMIDRTCDRTCATTNARSSWRIGGCDATRGPDRTFNRITPACTRDAVARGSQVAIGGVAR